MSNGYDGAAESSRRTPASPWRRKLGDGRSGSVVRIARPHADQTSRLAIAQLTPGWALERWSSHFLYKGSSISVQ
jgi:hypothetical protein